MKKFLMIMIAAFCCYGVANAQYLSSKELKKNSKKIAKQKAKEGFEAVNGTYTLDVLFGKFNAYLEEDEDNRVAIYGNAKGTDNKKVGIANAVNAGINEYSTRVAANVKGKIKSIMASDAGADARPEEIDKFGAAFESSVKNKISGLVKRHFIIRKQTNKNGTYDYEAYLSIDKAVAAKEAAVIAKEQLDAFKLQSLSDQVADFMGEALDEE